MKKILITGANGQLGRAIRKEYQKESGSVHVVLTDMTESENISKLDISSLDAVMSQVADQRPDVIINCAAYTNVDGCEKDEDMAYRANAIGPRNLAIAADKTGAKLFHISTDYVFSGTADKAYDEFDIPDPISAYGRTKFAGEQFVRDLCTRFFILRTAWLYGDGNNFYRKMMELSEKTDRIGVVEDQFGSPTSASELARAIHYLEPRDEYGVYNATCEGQCSWADFAERIFKKCNKSTKVERISSYEYKNRFPLSASRPKNSVLDNRMFRLIGGGFVMKDWKEAFDEYIKENV